MNDFHSPQKIQDEIKNHQEYANKKLLVNKLLFKTSGKFLEKKLKYLDKIKPEILQLRVSIFHYTVVLLKNENTEAYHRKWQSY